MIDERRWPGCDIYPDVYIISVKVKVFTSHLCERGQCVYIPQNKTDILRDNTVDRTTDCEAIGGARTDDMASIVASSDGTTVSGTTGNGTTGNGMTGGWTPGDWIAI